MGRLREQDRSPPDNVNPVTCRSLPWAHLGILRGVWRLRDDMRRILQERERAPFGYVARHFACGGVLLVGADIGDRWGIGPTVCGDTRREEGSGPAEGAWTLFRPAHWPRPRRRPQGLRRMPRTGGIGWRRCLARRYPCGECRNAAVCGGARLDDGRRTCRWLGCTGEPTRCQEAIVGLQVAARRAPGCTLWRNDLCELQLSWS